MNSTEKIAILLAVYNAEKYLCEQIDSILNQTYQNFIIYIHDDGSTDGTEKILLRYQKNYPDKIVLLDGAPLGGAKNNFFYLMNQVEAPVYMFCDQDDVWLKNKVKRTYKKIKKMRKEYSDDIPLLVSTDLKVVDENMHVMSESMRAYSKIKMKKSISLNKLLIQNYAVGCTLMFNKRLRDLAIQSDNPRIIMHDWWMALIAQTMGRYENIERATILYRQHQGNSVGADNVNLSYAAKNAGKLREKAAIIHATRLQAAEFCKRFEIKENKLVKDYADLDRKNKGFRIYFHLRHGINKQGIFRKIGIIICC